MFCPLLTYISIPCKYIFTETKWNERLPGRKKTHLQSDGWFGSNMRNIKYTLAVQLAVHDKCYKAAVSSLLLTVFKKGLLRVNHSVRLILELMLPGGSSTSTFCCIPPPSQQWHQTNALKTDLLCQALAIHLSFCVITRLRSSSLCDTIFSLALVSGETDCSDTETSTPCCCSYLDWAQLGFGLTSVNPFFRSESRTFKV